MTDVNYHDLASRWWVQAATPTLNERPSNKDILAAIFNAADLMGASTDGLKEYLKQLSPRKSKTDPESLAYYDNSYKYANERLTKVAPGRFLKRLLPEAPDQLVEGFTLWWKENVTFNRADYVFSIGNTREDFKTAFTHHYNTSGLNYTGLRKSISDSCMRYEFTSMKCHPAEVYASGDFEVVTIRDKEGKTRARCVVRVKLLDDSPCYVPGMIYASDNMSAEMIEHHLQKMGDNQDILRKNYHWREARILNITFSGSSVICPYIDNNRCVARYDDNYNILVTDGFNYHEYNSTAGYVTISTIEQYYYKPNNRE